MEKQCEYNGHKYWVKVEHTVHEKTGEVCFIAYVNDEKPGAFLYGTAVKDANGRIMLFATELSALTNANMIKQSELGKK